MGLQNLAAYFVYAFEINGMESDALACLPFELIEEYGIGMFTTEFAKSVAPYNIYYGTHVGWDPKTGIISDTKEEKDRVDAFRKVLTEKYGLDCGDPVFDTMIQMHEHDMDCIELKGWGEESGGNSV
jgi:hypothetical protein